MLHRCPAEAANKKVTAQSVLLQALGPEQKGWGGGQDEGLQEPGSGSGFAEGGRRGEGGGYTIVPEDQESLRNECCGIDQDFSKYFDENGVRKADDDDLQQGQ